MNFRSALLSFVLAASLDASSLHAEVKLSKVFTPHMVLQRGMQVPIWGSAAPGETVNVKFRDQTKSAVAGSDGKWSVKLDALKPGGPDVLTIGDKQIDDVLVGDVWVGSGQSNMDMLVPSIHGEGSCPGGECEGDVSEDPAAREKGRAMSGRRRRPKTMRSSAPSYSHSACRCKKRSAFLWG